MELALSIATCSNFSTRSELLVTYVYDWVHVAEEWPVARDCMATTNVTIESHWGGPRAAWTRQ